MRDTENDWKESEPKLLAELNKLITKIDKDLIGFSFNTAVAGVMKFTNGWADSKTGLSKKDIAKLMQIFAPIAPFVTEEIWEALGEAGSIHLSAFPKAGKVVEEEVLVVAQINGKTRGTIRIKNQEASIKEEVEKLVLADEKIKKWVSGKYKTIFVPGRLINFVLG
jgi:leucyl-tRNA synthetase